MATDMQKLIGTSEDEEEEMEMDVKEEDDDDDEDEEKHIPVTGMVSVDGAFVSSSGNNRFQHHQQIQEQGGNQSGGRRCRPVEEKERTKLRERHRRAITARILAGLRRHGNYNLRVRADINDVISALAREAGWVVLPDGTTFPSRTQVLRQVVDGPDCPVSAGGAFTMWLGGIWAVPRPAGGTSTAVVTSSSSHLVQQQTPPTSLRGVSSGYRSSVEYNASRMKGVFVPASSPYDVSPSSRSHSAVVMGDRGGQAENHPLIGGSMDAVDDKQVVDMPPKLQERDFAGTPYIPVYVMLPLGVINMKCELVDPDGLLKQLRILKSVNVDGVMVDCWWGIVEAHAPQEYNWNGYKRLFQIVRELKLKLQADSVFDGRQSLILAQVVLSFHECGGNVGDDVCIPLPHWVAEIGRSNPDIFFTDREGRRNPECLSWGIDKERNLRGRTAVEVYFDFMRSFRVEFDDFFEDGIISMIEVGLGPCGELRYPSYPVKHGWRYPGIGEFQCYDQYLLKNLRKAAEARGHAFWARGPDNVGSYNSQPHETGFFCDGGDYDGYYARFFLNWYSQVLVDHGDRVLSLAKLAFEGTSIAAKLPEYVDYVNIFDSASACAIEYMKQKCLHIQFTHENLCCLDMEKHVMLFRSEKLAGVHWWYKTTSHAAELMAGFYNPCNRDGYAAVMAMLKKHGAALNFTCAELHMLNRHEDFPEAMADPEGLAWQVLNAAWDVCIPVVSENALLTHDRESYNKILENAKPLNDPDGRHFSSFTYLRLSPLLMERHNFLEFERFVKRMHGEAVLDLQL
ncbi:Beta-amylase 7 [Vitis vinifera]|uniref:Beta-amylase n=1 Tax=Vitis vinifera TaxID=29760 RepID=A0A438JM30_VITVI|nr:Beta-amylase 7 [Vitis vinifera]